MKIKKSGSSDEGNTSFAPHVSNFMHVKAGFDPGETGSVSPGHHRFPRRKSKDEIPQQSLAERLRAKKLGR
jgi:hypothetical protein